MRQLYVTAASKVGCVRPNNEDMVLVGSSFIRNDEFQTRLEVRDDNRLIVAVADGMGGHLSGEVASSEALHNFQFFFNDIPSGLDDEHFKTMMAAWLQSINAIIDSKGRVDETLKGMGTTLVGLCAYEGQVFSLNCGDSRLYRLRHGSLSQLTTDHSFNKEVGIEKHCSIITNCIGGGANSSFFDIERMTDELLPNDIYLLCSDGLTDMLNDQKIEQLLKRGADASALCNAAEIAGGLDNVSVCVIDVES